jgi:uncharacterized protein YigA (DUF484 family)
MRALYALSEDILTADSPTVIARRLSEVLQRALEISHVRLYVTTAGRERSNRWAPNAATRSLSRDRTARAAGLGCGHVVP